MSMNVKHVHCQMLRSILEAQDQLEREYISRKEEHRALEMQSYLGLSRKTGIFDPNRLKRPRHFASVNVSVPCCRLCSVGDVSVFIPVQHCITQRISAGNADLHNYVGQIQFSYILYSTYAYVFDSFLTSHMNIKRSSNFQILREH